MLFDRLEDAERYVEAVDVREGSWVFFDAGGRQLSAEVREEGRREIVRIVERGAAEIDVVGLRGRLIRMLSGARQDVSGSETASIESLIERARRAGY